MLHVMRRTKARTNTGRRRSGETAVTRYRRRMKRAGMRLVQFWVPDTSAPGFAGEFRRQVQAVAADRRSERRILREIEALSADLDLGQAPEFVTDRKKNK